MIRFRCTAIVLALSLSIVAACGGGGGGDDEEASSDQPTTDATDENEPDEATGTVEVAGGLVTFELPEGWEVEDQADEVPEPAFLQLEDSWSLDEEQPVVELATVSNGSVTVTLGAEPLYEAVDEPTWREATLDWFDDRGASFNIEAPGTWADQPSRQVIGTLDGGYLRLDLAEIDSQLLAAQTRADDTPSEDDQRDITAFLDSVEVDDSVFGPLQNGLDARLHVDPAETGAGPFTVSTLVPLDWVHNAEATVGQIFEDPESGESFVQFTAVLDESGLEGEIEREQEEFADDAFFEAEPEREELERDGLPIVVLWDGDPDDAIAAAVYGTDGVIFFGVYIVTDDNEVLHAVVDNLLVIDHN